MTLYFGLKMNQTIKRLKPIDIDLNLIYQCPICDIQHWLTLSQTQTKNFILVCDCGNKFKLKTVQTAKIVYQKKLKTKLSSSQDDSVPLDILKQCGKILIPYGFEKTEIETFVTKAYRQLDITERSIGNIIKLTLILFGENNV